MRLQLLLTPESLLSLNQYGNMFPSGEDNPANVIKGYLDKRFIWASLMLQLGEAGMRHLDTPLSASREVPKSMLPTSSLSPLSAHTGLHLAFEMQSL